MKSRLSILLLLLFIAVNYISAQNYPFSSESRFLLAGFQIPVNEIVLTQLPVYVDHSYPYNFTDQDIFWIYLFIDPIHPLYQSSCSEFKNFLSNSPLENLKGLVLNSEITEGNGDPYGRAARLLGITEYPALFILSDEGRIIARREGSLPDWNDALFTEALMDLSN